VDRWSPTAALRLPNGDLIVADRIETRLFRLVHADSTPVRLPSPGSKAVEWTALALAPGLSFYALDGPGRKIHQYDWRGNYLGEALDLARVGQDEELGPVEPAGLAVSRAGHALVSDRTGDRLLAFGPGWAFLGVWGQSGGEAGSWRRPGAMAAGETGFVVADEGNRRAVALDDLGNVTALRDLDEAPRGVAALGDGFAIAAGSRVEIVGPGLRVVQVLRLAPGPGCGGAPYVTPAVAGDRATVVVGEGCSGRLAAFPRREE
jgi:hypothetical protein